MPKLKNFELKNKIIFKTKEQLLEDYNQNLLYGQEKLTIDKFHWVQDRETACDYYNEQIDQLDYVSDPENSKTIIKMLLDDFEKKYDIKLDFTQVQYYMTKTKSYESLIKKGNKSTQKKSNKDNEIIDKREELENKLIERQGKKVVNKSIESAPWDVLSKGELDSFPLIANKSNYTDMYFGLISQVGKQLDKKFKDNTQAKKDAFKNMLMDYGQTLMGIYAACGGFKCNADKNFVLEKEDRWPKGNVKDDKMVLYTPMLGDVSEGEYFGKLNEALPANFLRDRSEEEKVDYREIGKTVTSLSKSQIKFLANQLKEAKRTYDSHWGITKYFSTLSIFKNNKFFKKVRSEARECRNMEKVAMLFAPSTGIYKDDNARIKAGSRNLLSFANKGVNDTLANLSTAFRKEVRDKVVSNVHSVLSLNYAIHCAGAGGYNTIPLNAIGLLKNGMLSKVYGVYALKKISEVTNIKELYIGNVENSSIKTYGEESLSKEETMKYFDTKGVSTEKYEGWTQQIDYGLIKSTSVYKTAEQYLNEENESYTELSKCFKESNYKNIKFEDNKDVILEGTENNVSKEEVENVIKGTKYEDKIKTDDLPSKNDLDTENNKEEELIESEEETDLDLLGEHVGGGKTNKKSKFIEDKEKSKENEKGIDNN